MKRRDFMRRSLTGAGACAVAGMWEMYSPGSANAFPSSGGIGVEEALYIVEKGKEKNKMPAIRPEILKNPKAVFLIETHVDAKKDASGHFTEAVPQLEAEGKRIAEMLFVKSEVKGGSTFIKPNFTWVPDHCYNRTTGVYSSPDFIVGMAGHLRNLGNTNLMSGEGPTESRIHRLGGVYQAFDPAELPMLEAGYERFEHFRKDDINWTKTKNSLFWKSVPHIRPVNDPDNFLINVSAMKCHFTALTTLSIKNLQGLVPKGYGQLCTSWGHAETEAIRQGIPYKKDFLPDFHERIEESFLNHRKAGYKRWDPDGCYDRYQEKGGWEVFRKIKSNPADVQDFMKDVGALMSHEMWIQRGLDNVQALRPAINIIEGIIGLDGEELNRDKIGDDQLCNIVMVGVSPYELDAVGSYVMGHDPKELWYLRAAKEKGLGENDIEKIDKYWIRDGEIIPVKSTSEIKRFKIGLNWAREKDPQQRLFW